MDLPFLLVSLPQLDDDLFSRSVVLITEQNEQGSSGVIINKVLLSDEDDQARMVAEVRNSEGEALYQVEEDLYHGGPVQQDQIFVLHDMPEWNRPGDRVSESLFFTKSLEVFQHLLEDKQTRERRRFFLGCSQWEKGQLESELRSGAWMMLPFKRSSTLKELFPKGRETGLLWEENFWKQTLEANGMNPFNLMAQGSVDLGYN